MKRAIKAAFFGLISIAFVGSAIADITFVSWGGAYTLSFLGEGLIQPANKKLT